MRIPLVRTEGKIFTDNRQLTVDSLLDPQAVLQLEFRWTKRERQKKDSRSARRCTSTRASRAARSSSGKARRSEARSSCCTIPPSCAKKSPAGHTKFDSGGLWHGFIKFDPAKTAAQCREWGQTDPGLNTLANWRANVDEYVRAHFENNDLAYVDETHPRRTDTEQLGRMIHHDNDRRAWNYEVRVHRDHPLHTGLRSFVTTEESLEAVRNRLENTEDDVSWNCATPLTVVALLELRPTTRRSRPSSVKRFARRCDVVEVPGARRAAGLAGPVACSGTSSRWALSTRVHGGARRSARSRSSDPCFSRSIATSGSSCSPNRSLPTPGAACF